MEQNSISSDLIRGHIDTIILYSLIDGDKFAQQISDSIEQKSNNEYKINQATLYSSLKRLETLKHVSSYMNDAGELGRRKFFRLTTQGRDVIERNLLDWSYSKSIIDKLMDSKDDSTQVKEKIVYVYSNDVNKTPTNEVHEPISQPSILENNKAVETNVVDNINKALEPENPKQAAPIAIDEKNDINFRSVLNSLIIKSQKPVEKKPETVTVDNVENKKQNLNETISNESFNKSSLSAGKIDFGDLKIKASKEGYKLSVSSKDSALSSNLLMINKLNLFSAFIILLLALVEFLPIYLVNKQSLNVSSFVIVLFFLVISAYPIYALTKYLLYKDNKNVKLYSDSILTCAIIIFNLLLLNLAIVFLANMDFSIKANLIKFVYTPVILMFNALIFMAIRYWLSKTKLFNKSK